MNKLISNTLLLTILSLFLTGCENPSEGNIGAMPATPGLNGLMRSPTTGALTIPSSGQVNQFLDESLRSPCPDCEAEEVGVASEPRETTSNAPVCRHYNTFIRAGVPEKALKQALTFYSSNRSRFNNSRWVSIADYTDNSRNKRFYMLNMETGEVRNHHVSHGQGDPNHDGNLDSCSSNGDRTNMTRPGFFKVAEPYYSSSNSSWPSIGSGANGVRMDGLSGNLNDHARNKGVVMHGANYNTGAVMGRSYGCPAFRPNEASGILNTIKGGSLYYSYVGENCGSDQAAVDRTVPGWQNTCN